MVTASQKRVEGPLQMQRYTIWDILMLNLEHYFYLNLNTNIKLADKKIFPFKEINT